MERDVSRSNGERDSFRDYFFTPNVHVPWTRFPEFRLQMAIPFRILVYLVGAHEVGGSRGILISISKSDSAARLGSARLGAKFREFGPSLFRFAAIHEVREVISILLLALFLSPSICSV